GLMSLFDYFPDYTHNGTFIGAFGSNSSKAIQEAGLQLHIKAPEPQVPSMIAALEKFLATKK
ncbi:MAG: uroporphyrinogen-III synthase, partial [Sphingobacteriales bacterium]